MEITFPALQSINDNVSMLFNDQLWAVGTRYDRFSLTATSTGAAEVYPRLNMLPGLREWLGDRVVNSLSQTTFTITNRLFEETIAVARTDIEDDRLNLLAPIAGELGANAGRLPDILSAGLLKVGHQTIIYDGQNFFDTAHPDYTSTGAPTTSPNFAAGASTPWFLFDVSRNLKPLIFQRRRPFQIIPKFSMTDQQVFWNKEFEWGVDGRCNVGFGIWQLAYMSQMPLTVENLQAARTQMASYRRPDGSPMGVRGTLLVVPSSLYPQAKALAENEMIPNTYSNSYVANSQVTLYPNPLRGMFGAFEDEWLN
ncbi:MAG TPA: Mu-like prophage major head subunit gpT family protein [Gammaproteobacteria bacterium]|nr:Mu-like prophage major head subunit gpT family protein [Gammaproteobacteria bacterium]